MLAAAQDSITNNFSPIQEQVIAHLSTGLSFTAAADAAGVHRNTILNWRREIPAFAAAFEQAAHEQARACQEEALEAVPLATQTILAILNDPTASPSIRLRAAGMILKMADLKSAQTTSPSFAPSRLGEKAVEPEIVHNPAQSNILPFRRAHPKVGRNEPCPCGSGRKYKICCLDSPARSV
jgi:transposase-like protein